MRPLESIPRYFKTCCSGLKVFLWTRMVNHDENSIFSGKVNFDLTDRTTFFAWQRNHMANERTFLAWCRTGISLIIFSFVIQRFDYLIREMQIFANRPDLAGRLAGTHRMGLLAFALGTLIILIAGWRFFYIRRHINRGDIEFSALPDIFLLLSILFIVILTFLFFSLL